jgi:hypothetical protein
MFDLEWGRPARRKVRAGHLKSATTGEGLPHPSLASGHSSEAWASSEVTFLVRFGSTWTPGPMVVETVTFLM